MAAPRLNGLHHIKLPVSDLDTSLTRYGQVFGAEHLTRFDHHDGSGVRYAVTLQLPASKSDRTAVGARGRHRHRQGHGSEDATGRQCSSPSPRTPEVETARLATTSRTIGRISSMAKEKISVTVDAAVLAATDADARAAGLNRSEMIEQALRNEHLRVALQNYTTRTVPALDIDAYAQKVYQANRAAGL